MSLKEISTNTNFKINIPNEAYNIFVNSGNYKSSFDIPFNQKADQYIETSATGGNTEKYNFNLNSKAHHAPTFIRDCSIRIDVKGIQYGQNRQLLSESFVPDNTKAVSTLDDYQGLPHPYLPGIAGFVCDPVNSMIQTNTVSMGLGIESFLSNPAFVNCLRKSTDMSVLKNGEYDSLLYPDTVNLDSMQLEANKFQCVPFEPICNKWSIQVGKNKDPKDTLYYARILKTNKGVKRDVITNNIMTLEHINESPNNMLSFHRRGKVFEKAEYIFSKTHMSQNYRIEIDHSGIDTGKENFATFVPVGKATTTLYTGKIGLYQFPTNIENWKECLDIGISFYDICYYFNKTGYIKRKTSEADTVPGTMNNEVISTNLEYVMMEPDNQSVNVSIYFPRLKAPLISPILNDNYRGSFTHVSTMTVDLQYTNLDKIFKVIGRNGNGLEIVAGKILPDTTNVRPVLSVCNNGTISVILDNSRQKSLLHYRSFMMDSILESYVKPKSVIPFIKYSPSVKEIITYVQQATNPAKRTFTPVTIHSDVKPFSAEGVPRYILIYADIPLSYKFRNVEISFGDPKNHQMLRVESLRKATIDNGLHLYSEKDEESYLFINNNSPSLLSSNGRPFTQRFNGKGSILLLKTGVDFVLPESIVPGLTGNNNQIKFKIDMEFKEELTGFTDKKTESDIVADRYFPNQSVTGQLYITYMREIDWVIQENNAQLSSQEITAGDVATSYRMIIDEANEDKYYINRSSMYTGSGVINDVYQKAKVMAPKVIDTLIRAKKLHDSGVVQQGIKDLSKMTSQISAYMQK